MVQTQTPYRVKATFLETCNCDAGCNCNFGGFPDHGPCEALIGIQIDDGKIGDVDLSGMKVVLAVKWPKAIHEGEGAAAIFIDESATEEQVGGIATILTGQAGGMPWELLATTLTSLDGPHMKSIKMNVDGRNSGFSIDGILEAKLTPLVNPVTGEENEVHIVFPNGGLIWNDGDSASTSTMKVDFGGMKFDHTGQSAFFAPVEWTNQ
ncbi:MAG: DUF1326 domain-containing protein [Chloroflexi bacterium]|nr:DUF1326 domain-containing protein [Chloroflexota bacterium]MDA1271201.1 DUF1326 domain-containing protein [Chloroflexota bacterium]PKB59323.1 MAG: hypothetical protein BZY83_02520 [SAR202 cluster bacterium Casp-Chloro-G2]